MNKPELRTLKIQLLLLAGLFGGCLVLAVFIATQRSFFERFVKEKYAPLPTSLRKLAAAAAEGEVDAKQLRALSAEELLLLYDDWMAQPEPPAKRAPRVLLANCLDVYLTRAERSLVCGLPDQRRRALRFLEWGGYRDAVPVLERVSAWAQKRGLYELVDELNDTAERLRTAPLAPSAGEAAKPAE